MRAIEYQRYGPLEVLSPGGAADAAARGPRAAFRDAAARAPG